MQFKVNPIYCFKNLDFRTYASVTIADWCVTLGKYLNVAMRLVTSRNGNNAVRKSTPHFASPTEKICQLRKPYQNLNMEHLLIQQCTDKVYPRLRKIHLKNLGLLRFFPAQYIY